MTRVMREGVVGLMDARAGERATGRECLAAGGSPDLDQGRLDPVAWLERHRAPLVQACFEGDPMPPGALIDAYGVKAQVLVPVENGGQLTGWVSVHGATERAWSTPDGAASEAAATTIAAEID